MQQHREPVSFIATDKPEAAQAALVFLDGSPDRNHVLRVQITPQFQPAPFTAHGWRVSDIAREIEALSAKGVAFLRFDQLPQDALGIWTAPDGSKIAWLADPSGNILSLTEHANG